MEDVREYIVSLYTGCRNPVKQIDLITQLTGQDVRTVIKVLKEAKRIPWRVTAANYKETLKEEQERRITPEVRQYIIGSIEPPQTVAFKLKIPIQQVIKIRRIAREEAIRDGRRTAKKRKARSTSHA